MSTYKDRKTWWISIRHNNIRYRKRSPENSKAGAEAFEAVLRQKLARGEPMENVAETQAPLFKEFAQQWYETYVVVHNKYSEQRNKRIVLSGQLVPFFGAIRLNDISSLKIEQYKMNALSRGLSPKTVNNQLGILGKCLRDAQQWQLIKTVPIIKKLRVPPARFDFLTPLESNRLLEIIDDPFWHLMVLLALKTGLRLSELKGLKWEDVDLDRKMLAVRRGIVRDVVGSPKSNRERHIPLTQQVVEALQKRPVKVGWVFSLRNGTHMQHGAPEKAMKRMYKAAGLRKIGWHTLRHTFASHLVGRGVNVKAVQDLLGHADIQTTMRYAHLAPSELRTAIDVLEPQRGSTTAQNEKNGQRMDSRIFSVVAADQDSNYFPA